MTTPQGKDWAVMTAVERLAVNDQGTATTTFTVTNLQDVPSSVTAAIIADDVARGWFTVEEPVRFVEAGHSVSYVVRIATPPSAPAAEYTFQLLAYSSDKAPEENPTFSSRVVLEMPATPSRKRSLMPILLAAGVVAVVIALVITLVVVISRDDAPPASPSPPATSSAAVSVPNVIGETEVDSITGRITDAGLIPILKYRHSASPAGAIAQNPAPSQVVAPGTPVEVTVAVVLTEPTEGTVTIRVEPQRLPSIGADIPPRVVVNVALSWEQAETYVRAWRVVFLTNVCQQGGARPSMDGALLATQVLVVDTPQLRIVRHYTPRFWVDSGTRTLPYSCSAWAEAAHIEPLDDFGRPGPSTTVLMQPDLSA